jgi:hypothetical protein
MNDVVSFADYFRWVPPLVALVFLYFSIVNFRDFLMLRKFKDVPYNDPELEEMAQKLREAGHKPPSYGLYSFCWAVGFVYMLYVSFSI